MFIKKKFSFIVFAMILYTSIEGKVTIIESSVSETKVNVNCSSYSIRSAEYCGGNYKTIIIPGSGRFDSEGYPSLPSYTLCFAGEIKPQILITDIIYDTLYNIKVLPSSELLPSEKGQFQIPKVKENREVYNSNSFYPLSCVDNISKVSLRGVPIHRVSIVPARYNPATEVVIIAIDMTLIITHGSTSENLTQKSLNMINNIVINKNTSSRDRAFTSEQILILTNNHLKNAANTLALWQRKKGYSPIIISKSSWDTSSIKNTVHTYYNNASVKPTHLLLLGDHTELPTYHISIVIGSDGQPDTLMSDNPYVCITGNDFYPEMTKSRISVSTESEALDVINKSMNYEINPPSKSSFYKNAIAATYFQDYNNDGIDDMGFIMPMEQSKDHLASNGIISERIYYAESSDSPQFHHSQLYNQEALPSELQGSNYPWNGDKQDLISSINDGRFLIYHYDHGFADGWGDPAFTSSDLNSLSNNNLLPIIFSIDCWVGKFWQTSDCFAENVTNRVSGGAAGIVASTYLSLSGYNDALLTGLIDAIWPGLSLEGAYMNTSLTAKTPIYTMADILNHGLFKMTESWGNYYCDPQFEQQYNGYHWFGDPTLQIWTEEPQEITHINSNFITENSNIYTVSNLNISSEIISLYNPRNDSMIGIDNITGPQINLSINPELYQIGDTLELTIISHNKIPIIKNIPIEAMTNIKQNKQLSNSYMSIKKNVIKITNINNESGSLQIIDMRGRLISSFPVNKDNRETNIKLSYLSNGTYIAKLNLLSLTQKELLIIK